MEPKDDLVKRLIALAEQRAQEEADLDYEEWLEAQELENREEETGGDPDQYKDDHT